TGFQSFVRAVLWPLGITQLERAIVNILVETEILRNYLVNAIERLQREVDSLKDTVFQNCMVLDMFSAHMGGVCTLITESCCSYIDESGKIFTDVQ
ncbi:ERVV1 protein, partial [Atrichornis clamosus]|nr:ERVV1 protein [Atrichornis clamosus]